MSDDPTSSFGKFVPGFDFLQNLAKGATQGLPQMPQLGNWVAPTLSVEELDKRIAELRAVQFWLDQNTTALKATIQALEVQKMTLATLKGMNLSMNELAGAFQLKPMPADKPAARAAEKPVDKSAEPATKPRTGARSGAKAGRSEEAQAAPGVIDPLQWWGALTQQFQEIASTAMREAAARAAPDAAPGHAAAREATAAKRGPARKAPARKSAG